MAREESNSACWKIEIGELNSRVGPYMCVDTPVVETPGASTEGLKTELSVRNVLKMDRSKEACDSVHVAIFLCRYSTAVAACKRPLWDLAGVEQDPCASKIGNFAHEGLLVVAPAAAILSWRPLQKLSQMPGFSAIRLRQCIRQ